MASTPFEADLDKLLAPISAEAPAGTSLRYEGTYAKIQEARREDDPTLPQGVWEKKLKARDDRLVISLATEALEKRTKDLQIAIWLAEAWLIKGRFQGLAAGLSLAAGLLERYWDTCFPVPDDDGDARISLIDWVDDMFTRKIRQFPFTDASAVGPSYTLDDWEAALSIDRPGSRTRLPESEGTEVVSRESILARISLTGRPWWIDLRRDVKAGVAAAEALEKTFAGKVPHPPLLMRLKEALGAILGVAEDVLELTKKDAPPEEAPIAMDPDEPSSASPDGGGGQALPASPTGPTGPIKNRAEAYRKLSEAADFLLRTEPHSPVPYLVKRAISWGNMSLGELLYEFVGSPDDLVSIQRLLGMRGKE
ncbi:MAG: type VI secretion system protein TssA [Byssovorax sp.]